MSGVQVVKEDRANKIAIETILVVKVIRQSTRCGERCPLGKQALTSLSL